MTTAKYLDILLKGIQKQYKACNFNQALELSDQAFIVAERHGEVCKVNDILIEKAKIYKKQGVYTNVKRNFEKALYFLKQIELAEGSTPLKDLLYITEYASLYFLQGDFESAKKILSQALDNTEKFREPLFNAILLLARAGLAIEEKRFKQAESLLEEILLGNQYAVDNQYLGKTYTLLLKIYTVKGQFNNMAKYANLLLPLSKIEQNLEYEAVALNCLGITCAVKGEYKSAFEYFTQAIEKSEYIGYDVFSAKTTVNLGAIFSELRNFEEALKIYHRVEREYEHVTNDYTKAVLTYNIGGMYSRLERFDKSIEYFKKAVVMSRKDSFSLLEYKCLYELSNAHIQEGLIEEGLEYAKLTQNQKEANESLKESEVHLINMGVISNKQGDHETALDYTLKGIAICQTRNNNKTLRRGYEQAAFAYKKLGDYDKAYDYLEKFNKESEKAYRDLRKRQLIDLEIKYELKEKEREISTLKDKMKIQAIELRHQKEIEVQNQKLKMANEELKQFTYAISHDLKEPLRMIGSFAKLWYRRNQKKMDERDREYFDYIHDGATRMTAMLNGLLDYATLGNSQKDFKEVDLNEVALAVQKILTLKVHETNAVIDVDALPIVKTNRVLVFQLMQNLISNALKFISADKTPHIEIKTTQQNDYHIISVTDNGIGIPKPQQKAIFSIFKRLHTKEDYEGTGLGLAFCKKIIHHLNGKIWLESEEGIGTTFYFSIPKH